MKNTANAKVERVHILTGEGPTKAFCDILFMESLIIKGLRVVEGKEGLFVSMPREQGRDGKWYDLAHPLTKEMRQELQDLVLESYMEKINEE